MEQNIAVGKCVPKYIQSVYSILYVRNIYIFIHKTPKTFLTLTTTSKLFSNIIT